MIDLFIPDKSNYALHFTRDQQYRYLLQVIDDRDMICCSFRIPIDIYDEILMHVSEKSIYGFTKDYPVITIDVPPNSMRYRYVIILLNDQEFLIIKKIDIVTRETISEYYINYENI